jgi:malate permease and related proteins
MSAIALAQVVAIILLLVAVGVALRLGGLLDRDAAKPLNTVLIYAAIPSLVFLAVYRARLEFAFLAIVGVAWVVALVGLLAAWVVGRALRLERPTLGAFMLVAALGNTGYLGYPIATALFGEPGLVRAVFYDVFGTVVVLLTVGIVIAQRFGDKGERANPIREIVTFPVVIAVVLAFVLKPFVVPALVTGWLDALAKMTVPLIMISLGLTLDWSKLRGHLAWSGAAAGLKLLVLPLLGWGLAALLLREPLLARVAVVQAGMPSMMLSLVFAARFGLDEEFTASAIVLTTTASIVTLPALVLLAR